TLVPQSSGAAYTAKAIWSDGYVEPVAASWSSSQPGIAAINGSGQVTTSAVGSSSEATLMALYTAGSVTRSAQFTITVAPGGYVPPILSLSAGSGFNLAGNSAASTLDVVALVGSPSQVVTNVTSHVTAVWKWSAASGRWAFYSP